MITALRTEQIHSIFQSSSAGLFATPVDGGAHEAIGPPVVVCHLCGHRWPTSRKVVRK